MHAARVEDLRTWQLTYEFKLAVYRILRGNVVADARLRDQIRDSAASAVSQIEEGFARFYPKDFGRMVVGGRASLKECCGHLRDAVDRGYIPAAILLEPTALAEDALKEMAGLIDYLQSPEAERNARLIRERRAARRQQRKEAERQPGRPEPQNREPANREQRNEEPRNEEPRTPNPEP